MILGTMMQNISKPSKFNDLEDILGFLDDLNSSKFERCIRASESEEDVKRKTVHGTESPSTTYFLKIAAAHETT